MILLSIIGLAILLALSFFQIALILGAPIGHFAWGGQHKVLPNKLRVGSAISILLYTIFAIFLANSAGIVDFISGPVLGVGMWIITIYFFLGVVLNAISRSKKERAVMTPTALLLAIIFLLTILY